MARVRTPTHAHRGQRATRIEVALDSTVAASVAGLRYVSDQRPGLRRKRAGRHFRYSGPDGQPVHDAATIARLRSLRIPPAWSDVWVCPSAQGHIQATGRDAKGRKQCRYHPRWNAVRDEAKYGRTVAFARALPAIRARVAEDLARPALPREKVLATVVRLLETTLIRVGNEEYARHNRSFGLTTMRDQHVDVSGAHICFRFRGKGGKQHVVDVRDPRLARIVKRCRDVPGFELFQHADESGEHRSVQADDVNAYLRDIAGQEFSAKDFRTWAGTVLAARALQEFEAFDSEAQAKRNVVRAIETVAERLGNTPAICRRCYVHPAVLDAYLDGSLVQALRERVEEGAANSLHALPPEEAAVLALLHHRLGREATNAPALRTARSA